MFEKNDFIKIRDEKKNIKIEIENLGDSNIANSTNTFPYETNVVYEIPNTDIKFAIGARDKSGFINFFVNKNFALDLGSEYESPLRTFYPELVPNPFKSLYGMDKDSITIKLQPNIKMVVTIEEVELVKPSKKEIVRGSIVGGAIGDAIGYQIEFQRGIKDKQVRGILSNKGLISDDTQMTLFTANGLLVAYTRSTMKGIGIRPIDAIYEAYLDWLDTQNNKDLHKGICWLKHIPDLRVPRAPGNTCIGSLSSGNKGTLDEPINNSKGCGGIMRIAPIGLYLKDTYEAGRLAAEATALTHGHPLGIIPSYFVAVLISILTHEHVTLKEAVDKTIKQYDENFNIYGTQNKMIFMSLVNKAIELSEKDMVDIDAIYELGEGWVAEETLAIALYSCLKYSNSFEDAIICSINHDGDSDSTGAVTGNIMGAYLGINAIPKDWLDKIELLDILEEVADDLSIEVPVSEHNYHNDQKWIDKYVNYRKV